MKQFNWIVSGERRGQVNLFTLVVLLVMFLGIVIFLFSFTYQVRDTSGYMDYYVHSLLGAVLRSDTGYLDSNCKLVSDALACSFTKPSSYRCEGSGPTCLELSTETIEKLMKRYETIRENYRYLFVVKPEGFISKVGGEKLEVKFGDESLLEEKTTKMVANEKVQKVVDGEPLLLGVKIIVARK